MLRQRIDSHLKIAGKGQVPEKTCDVREAESLPACFRCAWNGLSSIRPKKETRDSYFDFEQAVILDFWVEIVR